MSEDPRAAEAGVLAFLGDLRGAAAAYERAGLTFQAAEAYVAAGEPAAALQALLRVPAEHPRHREACVAAVRLADEQDRVSLALENLLARFVRSGPLDDTEAEAFDRLSRLYERQGLRANAREALTKLVAFRPAFPEAAQRLKALPYPAASAPAALPPLPEPRSERREPKPPDAGTYQALDEEDIPIREGVTVGGRYRLEARIGSGGMAIVFRARDLEMDDLVAIKVFTQAVFDSETDARQRRELMLSRQLVHPNVVRVFEMGRAYGLRYMSQELLVGMTLAERLRGTPVSLAEGLGYLAQICAGLQATHDLGIVHRDVKPANCYIVTGGLLKLMDFGIARVRDAPGLTATGITAGTPAYMPPEQASDFRSAGPASDIYAVGVVAYKMFTRALPFDDPDPMRLLEMHRSELPRPPRLLNPTLPEELERIILRCLEKDPASRFSSCRELGSRVESLRAARS